MIIPAIYLKLKAHNILPYLPEELMQEFQKIYDLNCKRNLQILKQIDDITAILNKENIQPVFLKGTANLLDGLYSDVGERMIGDIDFLVKEEDYLRTAAILESKGYKHDEIYKLDFKSHKHYPTLCKEGEIAPVEIHWLPVRREHTRQFNAEVILRDKKEVAGKPGLYVPSNRHKVIHTFLHCQLENLGHQYKQSDFRGIYDLYLLSKRRNVSYLVGDTGYWKKAVAWFVFSQRVLGLPGRFYSPELWTAKWYCLKYDWSLSFVRTHNVYLFFKIGIRYAIRILKAIFSKDERLYIYRRLKYSKW